MEEEEKGGKRRRENEAETAKGRAAAPLAIPLRSPRFGLSLHRCRMRQAATPRAPPALPSTPLPLPLPLLRRFPSTSKGHLGGCHTKAAASIDSLPVTVGGYASAMPLLGAWTMAPKWSASGLTGAIPHHVGPFPAFGASRASSSSPPFPPSGWRRQAFRLPLLCNRRNETAACHGGRKGVRGRKFLRGSEADPRGWGRTDFSASGSPVLPCAWRGWGWEGEGRSRKKTVGRPPSA